MDKFASFDHYLGCGQHEKDVSEKDAAKRLENISNHLNIGNAKDTAGMDGESRPIQSATTKAKTKIRGVRYDMSGFVKQTVEKYLELTGKDEASLKKVATPAIDDHTIDPKEFEEKGELASDGPGGWHPAKVLMKMLYCARIVRFDLLWTICSLARQVTKWTRASDRKLHRLVSYLFHSQEISLEGFVGNAAWELSVMCYSDADFAGDIKDSKSTSGCYIALVGTSTFVPIAAMSKKQSVVSHSSTESEIVSLEQGMRSEALPFLTLWEYVVAMFAKDNRAKGQFQTPLSAVPAAGGISHVVDSDPWLDALQSSDTAQEDLYKTVLNFLKVRAKLPRVQLIVMEDNEAVTKIIKKTSIERFETRASDPQGQPRLGI